MRCEIYKYHQGDITTVKIKDKKQFCVDSIKYNDIDKKRWKDRGINNAIEWIKYEKYITDLWARRGIIWSD